MINKLSKYTYVAKISITNNLVYIWDFLGRNFFFIFIIFIYLQLWTNIFGSKGSQIGGFTLNQMIWYLVVTEIVTLSRSNVFREVSTDVKKGNIAYLLNKPYNYIFYSWFNSIGQMTISLFTNCTLGVIIGVLFVGHLQGFSLIHLPFILLSIIMGIFIHFFIYMLLALSAFWVEENEPFFWVYQKLVFTLGGMLIPLDLFPLWLQKISMNLPFAYVTYFPAKLAVNFSFELFCQTMINQLIYLSIFFGLTLLVYSRGVRALNVNGG